MSNHTFYFPDTEEIRNFKLLSEDKQLLVIKLGMLFHKTGLSELKYMNNAEWSEKVKTLEAEILKTHEYHVDLLNKERAIGLKERERIISSVAETEELKYKKEISKLNETNTQLSNDLLSLHSTLDEKHANRLTETRTYYEERMQKLQDKYDEQVKMTHEELQKINARNQNSTLKGQDGENMTFQQLNLLFPKAEMEDTHSTPGRGDFIMREDNFIMRIENNNYGKNVQKAEIDKFYRDLDSEANNDIQCAVFVSLKTGICNKNDFEFEVRNKKLILFIHKLSENFFNIVLAVKFFKVLLEQKGLDLTNKDILCQFKNMLSIIKRNFNKQKSRLDKYHKEHTDLIIDQELNIVNLYKVLNLKY